MEKLKPVYSFLDCREYLQHYYDYQKANTPGYSYRRFSELAGIRSPNYLQLVLAGKRRLTLANIHQFARAIGLSRSELLYFEALVNFSQAEDDEQRQYYRDTLTAIRKEKPRNEVNVQFKGGTTRWYFLPIIAALAGVTEGKTAKDVARMIGLSEAEILEILSRLEKRGIITGGGTRFFLPEDHVVFHDKHSRNIAEKKILAEQIRLSYRALKTQYEGKGKFYTHSFTSKPDRLGFYADQVKSFLERLTEASNQDPPEQVFQLNIQLFPLLPDCTKGL